MLATRRELLLGRWLRDARRWATSDAERVLYEWNARTQITLWGPQDSMLHEYAAKQWAGLMRGFYGPRWHLFVRELDAALAAGKPLDSTGFERTLRAWEDRWTHATVDTDAPSASTASFAIEPRGDAVAVSRRLLAQYGPQFFERDAVSLTTDKPATCSHALPQYPAHLANDGWSRDTNSYWATDVNLSPEAWWQVDLEKPTTVGRVVVVFFHGDRALLRVHRGNLARRPGVGDGRRSSRQSRALHAAGHHLPLLAPTSPLPPHHGHPQFGQLGPPSGRSDGL